MALDAYDNLILAEPGIFSYYPNDETTGTTIDDEVATKDLILASGTTSPSTAWGARLANDILPAFTAGHQALDFNGTNGHATSATSTTGQPPVTTGMIIEGWVRMDSSQSSSPTIMGNAAMIVQQFNGRFYGKIGSSAAFGNYSRTVGTVYHILLAWSGGASGTTNWSMYINGVLAGSGTVSVSSSTPNYTTVGGHWNGTLPFDGVVSRFAVYSGSGVYADASRLAASHYDAGVNGISSGSGQDFAATTIPSGESVPNPTVIIGGVTVTAAVIPSTASVPNPTVVQDQILTAATIASAAIVRTPSVTTDLNAGTAVPIASAAQVYAPQSVDFLTTVVAAPIASTASVPNPTVIVGGITVTAAGPIASAASVPAPSVSLSITFTANPISSGASVPSPTVVLGDLVVVATTIPSQASVPAPLKVLQDQTVVAGPMLLDGGFVFVPESVQRQAAQRHRAEEPTDGFLLEPLNGALLLPVARGAYMVPFATGGRIPDPRPTDGFILAVSSDGTADTFNTGGATEQRITGGKDWPDQWL